MKSRLAVLFVVAMTMFVMAQQSTPTPTTQTPAAAPAQSASQSAPQQQKPLVIPKVFTNLTVLPKDISKPDLLNVMKLMTVTAPTGRCSYCHAVSDDLTEGDLASDEKPTKVKARKMIDAIIEINKKYSATPKN